MPYANEEVKLAAIDRVTEALSAIVAAPGAGKRLAIDYIHINAYGGANNIFLSGDGGTTQPLTKLAASQLMQIVNSIHNPFGIFPCGDNQAFSLAQDSPNRVTGFVLYRTINN